jgi:hypothetical protein
MGSLTTPDPNAGRDPLCREQKYLRSDKQQRSASYHKRQRAYAQRERAANAKLAKVKARKLGRKRHAAVLSISGVFYHRASAAL